MQLFDTSRKTHITFTAGKVVTVYVCGITPYDAAHLGHIFTFMTYDLLQRRLESMGHEVRMVRNITDVDEPIFQRAATLGIPYSHLAERETAAFHAVLGKLNFRPLYAEPKASEYVPQMAEAVGQLLETGYAYLLDDDIYFDVSEVESFGSFSEFTKRLQLGLMAQRGGDPRRPGKRDPLDFLLWKGVSDLHDAAAWDTDLGRGRPGWHIECSVMSAETLGVPFDLHGGGNDLIFPHHECEVAQSLALSDEPVARTWLHVAALLLNGEKMSKSLGNLIFAKDVMRSYEPAVLRLALMFYHYHTGGEWRNCTLDQAQALLAAVRSAAQHVSDDVAETLYTDVCAALDNDLDTPHIIHLFQHFAEDYAGDNTDRPLHPTVIRTLDLIGIS